MFRTCTSKATLQYSARVYVIEHDVQIKMCLKLQKRELLQQKLQLYRHMIELEIRFILHKQRAP